MKRTQREDKDARFSFSSLFFVAPCAELMLFSKNSSQVAVILKPQIQFSFVVSKLYCLAHLRAIASSLVLLVLGKSSICTLTLCDIVIQ